MNTYNRDELEAEMVKNMFTAVPGQNKEQKEMSPRNVKALARAIEAKTKEFGGGPAAEMRARMIYEGDLMVT